MRRPGPSPRDAAHDDHDPSHAEDQRNQPSPAAQPKGVSHPRIVARRTLARVAVRREPLCPRCGSSDYTQISETQSRCTECGLGRTTQPLRAQVASPPDQAALQRAQATRHLDEIHAKTLRSFTDATFPFYGLDQQWQGRRWIAGAGSSNGLVHHLTLGHGDTPWDLTQPQLRVQTRKPRPVFRDDPRQDLARECIALTREQVGKLWYDTGSLPPNIRAAAFDQSPVPSDPTGPWGRVGLTIDATTVAFRTLNRDETSFAQAEHLGLLLGIESQAWPLNDTRLTTITLADLRAYEQGSKENRSRRPPSPPQPS